MSEKSSPKAYPRNRTDSLIGAGVRVEGNIRFNGVLRVMGEVLGDATCPADPQGMIVVEHAALVTGAVKAPHIIVGGRVTGALDASVLIEIQQGGVCTGGASYKELDVHAGGIIDGLLTPSRPLDSHRAVSGHPPPASASDRHVTAPPAALPGGGRGRRGRKHALAGVALALVLVAFFWVRRELPPAAAPTTSLAPAVDTAAGSAVPLSPPAVAEPAAPVLPKTAGVPAVLPVALPPVRSETPAIPPNRTESDSAKVVAVQGLNSEKPAGHIFVITSEPSVLFKRKRGDVSGGTRIEISQGKNIRVPVSRDEQFRVDSGRDVGIFYQGRKVPPQNIESGVWMSFVPLQAGAGGDSQ